MIYKKNTEYYTIEKTTLLDHFPNTQSRVLDLGCATGYLGKRLRELGKVSEIIGAEIYEPAAKQAQQFYDKIYIGDIENLTLPYENYFDVVACGDIIEHLRDPWAILKRIHGYLKHNGMVMTSIPNIRYWRVLTNLLFCGRFDYESDGVMDDTHLRFFTRRSFQTMLTQCGFVKQKHVMLIYGSKKPFFKWVTLRLFDEFLAYQFLSIAHKG
ncbi:MAG: class I SAM-dependent methyltransferase [Chitinivibrionales bacterium]|nr:class I SAM-dependent methyltransferase [Chitinivibrionales bacterium]